MRLVVCLCLVLCGVGGAVQNCLISTSLTDGEMISSDVYDSTTVNPVQPGFRQSDCACTQQECDRQTCSSSCHLESVNLEGRFFYLQFASQSGEMHVSNPIISASPLCNTNPALITIDTQAIARKDVLRPEQITTIELDYPCRSLSSTQTTGLFHIEVTVPVQTVRGQPYENVTFHFRKSCVTQPAPAAGLTVSFGKHTVVSKGVVSSAWRPLAANPFDVGFDALAKEVRFGVTFIDGDVGSISYDMLPPEYDETVIKSVEYRGSQFSNNRHTNFLRSGASATLIVSVSCQRHPHSRSVGEVIVGLANIQGGELSLRNVEFKFGVECPQHFRHITPLSILFLVLGLFTLAGCVGGVAYNLYFTPRRGLRAVPFMPSLLALVWRRPKRYTVIDDADDELLMGDDEIRATVARDDPPAYGTIIQ